MDGEDLSIENKLRQGINGFRPWRSALERAVSVISPPGIPRWKRVVDLGVILIFSPGILPICAGIALVIKLGSKGPVLFRQRRVGHRGREFTCFKFRTMRPGVETDSHKAHTQRLIKSRDPMVKLDNRKDPRVIPFGGVIRACGLDELPQLLNVLRGEMSVVGPRPCIPYEYEMYEDWHRQRLEAVPGLTGLWQVSGKNRTTFEEMVKLDIRYASTQSAWVDVKIILKTVPAIWTQYCDVRAARRRRSKASRPRLPALGKSIPMFRL